MLLVIDDQRIQHFVTTIDRSCGSDLPIALMEIGGYLRTIGSEVSIAVHDGLEQCELVFDELSIADDG